jgi:hypothetical protein
MESFKEEVDFVNPIKPNDKYDKYDKFQKNESNISLNSYISYDNPEDIDESKLTGIFGNIVKKMYPNVESSRITILIQSMAIFSSMLPYGKGFYYYDGSYKTFLNEFIVLVGNSFSGKGNSFNNISALFRHVDPNFLDKNITRNIQSGESLVYRLKDEELDPNDPYAVEKDKRLLLYQSEFSDLLTVSGREFNTLSSHIRNAFDGEDLENNTKGSLIKASKPYLSIIGHITPSELLNKFSNQVNFFNGFGNRFLWFYIEGSKPLARGGNHKFPDTYQKEIDDLNFAIKKVSRNENDSELIINSEFYEKYDDWYQKKWNSKSSGVLDSLSQRDPKHIWKLASVNALANGRIEVGIEDYNLALLIINYCNKSRTHLFGDKFENPSDQKVINFLFNNGGTATRTQISYDLFQRNKNSQQINEIRDRLENGNRIFVDRSQGNTNSSEIWSIKQ